MPTAPLNDSVDYEGTPYSVAPIPCSRPAWPIWESFVLLAIGAALMYFVQTGTGGVLKDEIGVPGNDSFYHIKMAAMLREHRLLGEFPWLRFSYFTEAGQSFISHHYGFHVLLAPFVLLSHHWTGDYLAGGRWAICLCFGVVLLLFNQILATEKVPLRWLWLFAFLLLPFQFFTRHSFIRAISPSLAFMLLITWLLFRKRHIWAALAIAGYIHLYMGGVLYAPLIVVVFALSRVIAPHDHRVIPGRMVLWALGGWIVGIVTHPYSHGMYEFLKLQVFGSGLSPDIPVGQEWKPYENLWWFARMSGPLLGIWIAAICLRLRLGPTLNAREFAVLLISFLFLVLTLKARRFIEYWPAFSLLSAGLLIGPIFRKWQGDFVRLPTARQASIQIGVTLALVVGVIGLIWIAWRLKGTGEIIRWGWLWAVLAIAYMVPYLVGQSLPRRVRAILVTSLFLAAFVALAGKPWVDIRREARCSYDLPAIQAAMDYLSAHSNPGDVVFTDDWDIFPVYFYYNSHNHYIVGLDPKFTHARRPDLWDRYVKVSRGEVPADINTEIPDESGRRSKQPIHVRLEDIRDFFGARFVVTDRDHKPLAGKLARATALAELIYPSSTYQESRNSPYLVFRIRDPHETVDAPTEDRSADPEQTSIYLSDLTPTFAEQGWGDLMADRSVDGGVIQLGGRTFRRGLGTHAPSELRYKIPDGFSWFIAFVGIDSETQGNGRVTVAIELDGKSAYSSPLLTGSSEPVEIRIPLANAKTMTLLADPSTDGQRNDHVDWADARFEKDLPKP